MTEDRFWTFHDPVEQEGTETIEVPAPSLEHLTYTGSFDMEAPGGGSFSKLLDAFPIPVLLVDDSSVIRFANVACLKVLGESACRSGLQFKSLFSPEQPFAGVQSVLESIFSDRKPQVAQGTLRVGGNAIWGRVHFRSLRMGDERSILVLVEDLTHERQQLALNRGHQEELLKAHAQLEQRVQERTSELREINERLQREIADRKKAEQDLRRSQELLELRVEERTAALKESNQRLLAEMGQRAEAERLTVAQKDFSTRLNAVAGLGEALKLCIETSIQVSEMDGAAIYLIGEGSSFELAAYEGFSEEFVSRASHLDGRLPLVRTILSGIPVYSAYREIRLDFGDPGEAEGFKALAAIPIPHEERVIACLVTASHAEDRISTSSHDAMEAITPTIGSALARLEAEEALRGAHQALEKRVEQRTKELVETNRRLELEIAQRQIAEDRMGESLREKEALLQEVHHRVKNNLQIISSLLALQATHVTDAKTLGVLQDSQSRIRSMAFIHEHLYQSTDLARIDFSEYVSDLIKALMQSYSETASRLSLKLELAPAFLSVGTALPCGLVINEIVSNCLKHAFPDGRHGEIRVSLSQKPGGEFELVVTDDGIGFPEKLNFLESGSLGLRLMKNLTELQLKGGIEMHSVNGTEVKVVFRDLEHR